GLTNLFRNYNLILGRNGYCRHIAPIDRGLVLQYPHRSRGSRLVTRSLYSAMKPGQEFCIAGLLGASDWSLLVPAKPVRVSTMLKQIFSSSSLRSPARVPEGARYFVTRRRRNL